MVLVPLLIRLSGLERRHAFASSVAVILPLCLVSVAVYCLRGRLDLTAALPFCWADLPAASWAAGCSDASRGLASPRLCPAHCLRRNQGADLMELLFDFLAGAATGVLSGSGWAGAPCFWCI
jgi:uncharacterized membrane protein YfcA